MLRSKGVLAAGGGFGVGLLLSIGGLVVKHAQAPTLAQCSTGLGQFGQVLNANAAHKCSTAQGLSSMATAAIWIGVIAIAIAVGGFVALLIASGARAGRKKPKTVVPGPSAAPVALAPWQPVAGSAPRPIVPMIVGQEDGAPADRGRRGVFATEPAAPGSGSEITAVLPIFAPAEPFDLTAPAMAPDRSSERSLAGVATGPQARLTDFPAPPASPAGPAGRPAPPVPQARRLADFPAPPVPSARLADRLADRPVGPVPAAGPADYPASPPPVARSADRPSAPRRVSASPPWGWADPPPAPGSTVSSPPPWAQTELRPAAPEENASPGPPRRPTERPPAVPEENASAGPPWDQTERPPMARQEARSSGPPWDPAEYLPAPRGAKPDGDDASQRHSGRHRSR
jgi:hypothetical protein